MAHTVLSRPLLLVVLPSILFVAIGCPATYNTTTRAELDALNGRGPIRALTVDSVLYTFEGFTATDTDLTGNGTREKNGVTDSFEGSLPFRNIVFIERTEMSIWKGVWVFPVFAGIVPAVIGMINSPPTFQISRPSGGSCPYVYAFDGTAFRLQAEAFGTSVSRALEGETYSLLPSLKPVNGQLKVRVANERPETHMINCTRLSVGEMDDASSSVLDVNNVLWPVRKEHPPVGAQDHSGKDILADLLTKDGHYSKSDLAHTNPSSGFRDEVYVEFGLPDEASEATLVIDAINTDLITEAYRSAGSVLGDATMEFYNALERDPQLQNTVREWVRDCSLRIEVANGEQWSEVGAMIPEANVAPFSRAIRIHNLKGNNHRLRIRLSSLSDVWRLDAVGIDYSAVKPITLHPLKMISADASDHGSWNDALTRDDTTYAILLPPNHIDVIFNASPAMSLKKPVYVFAAKGYLYEWLPSSDSKALSPAQASLQAENRVELFKLLLQHKDLFLPSIYEEWRQQGHDR